MFQNVVCWNLYPAYTVLIILSWHIVIFSSERGLGIFYAELLLGEAIHFKCPIFWKNNIINLFSINFNISMLRIWLAREMNHANEEKVFLDCSRSGNYLYQLLYLPQVVRYFEHFACWVKISAGDIL